MKPLISKKVQRNRVLDEWESSESQSTLEGLQRFAMRQRERLEALQGKKAPEPNIAPIGRRRP